MILSSELLFRMMKDLGIRYMFGTPGTTELPTVAIPAKYEIEYVHALHENVAMGMAMGYARQSGLPGVVSVHVAPGLAHAMGNLYNAWRARLPVIALAGNQHSQLIAQEPILVANMVEMARPFTKWSYELKNVYELPMVLQRAFKEAMTEPAGPVFLSLPVDLTLEQTALNVTPVTRVGSRICGDLEQINRAAHLLAAAKHPLIVAGDAVGLSEAWDELKELAELLHAPVYSEAHSSLMNYPNTDRHWQGELPTFADTMRQALSVAPVITDADGDPAAAQPEPVDAIFFVGFSSQAPLTSIPTDSPALIPEEITTLYLHNDPWEIGKNAYGEVAILGDVKTSLQPLNELVRALKAGANDAGDVRRMQLLALRNEQHEQGWAQVTAAAQETERITATDVAQELGLRLDGTPFVLVDEAMSNNPPLLRYIRYPNPRSYYSGRGISLGYSMASALGIQMADPSLQVVNVIGDGSASFYPHAFWTAAKEKLPVLFVVLNNQEYKTLKIGYGQMRDAHWHPAEIPSLDIQAPDLDFVQMAKAYGVEGERVETREQFANALDRVLSQRRPYVLDIRLAHDGPSAWPQGRWT